MPTRAASVIMMTVVASAWGSLRDPSIGAASLQYLDGKGLTSSWVASMSSSPPNGCDERVSNAPIRALLPAIESPRHLTGVASSKACCVRCWAEALCTSALFHANDGTCLLQTSDEAAVPSSEDEGVAAWTRCNPRRGAGRISLSIPANVPGDLITDLQNAKQIGDPLYEKTFLNSSIWSDHNWTYTLKFSASQEVQQLASEGGSVSLVFDGIKMGASITLDGEPIGVAVDQFYRYVFDVTSSVVARGPRAHALEVTFDPSIPVDGRFQACTGGWDWAPYSHTYLDGAHTFTKGIWKSVYLAATAREGAAITHVVPQIFYQGAYPTTRLEDGKHGGFRVLVRVFLRAAAASTGTLILRASWEGGRKVSKTITVPAGESNATIETTASAEQIKLWWPNGLGGAPNLYNLTVSFGADDVAPVNVSRVVGFRYVALVTGNDTDPSYVHAAASKEGTSSHGMFFRVNGVVLFSRGANVIPMDELEGRLSEDAHRKMVQAAVGGRFNTLRVWGGGMFLPEAFYDECDVQGLIVYHDMQYAQQGHAPNKTHIQEVELRHSIRRLSSHPSIVVWDGCNECRVIMGKPTEIYATFVMTIVAEEDQSRAVWPSCPALGWTSGVRMLDALPNGNALTTPATGPPIETHGPYQHGTGFPAVNGDPTLKPFDPNLPITVAVDPTGPAQPNVYASEFGAVAMSSFESMSPTLAPEHWGLHAGQPYDNCTGGFERGCVGPNVMSERNYPCDSLIDTYFGSKPDTYFNTTGEGVFKKQLYQCLTSQALNLKANIETRRSKNELGILVWQFNEIWPTGGWGSIEYGTAVQGQVVGGRWKPLHYLYRRSVFADVMAACGVGGQCYVKNDAAGLAFVGQVEVAALQLIDGTKTVLTTKTFQLAQGAGVSAHFNVDLKGLDLASIVLIATCYNFCDGYNGSEKHRCVDSSPLSVNEMLFVPPKALQLQQTTVSATVVAQDASTDGSIPIILTARATAVFVVLTTLAQGRFSDNAFTLLPGNTTITFIPHGPGQRDLLVQSLRVEHMQENL